MRDAIPTAPVFTAAEASAFARRLYGLNGRTFPLPSERDQNFLIETADGTRRVLKIANSADDLALLQAQNAALDHVGRHTGLCPRVIASLDGSSIVQATGVSGVAHCVRLMTWIAGIPLGDVRDRRPELIEDLGARVAELDSALDGFEHPSIHRDFYWDLAKAFAVVGELSPLVGDAPVRALVTQLVDAIARIDGQRLAGLRRAAVHNDPNDYNVLVDAGRVTGILDFGDMVYSYGIADLAIAAAYALLGQPDPLDAAVRVVRGYQRIRALADDEIDALPGLIALRLCTSVCIAARQRQQRPDDPYLSVSQGPIAESLPRLAALDRREVADAFRAERPRSAGDTLVARRRFIGPNLSIAYRRPVKIVRGWMQYLYDEMGRQYIDAYNNVPHVGHCHPRVVNAATQQLRTLNTNTRYLHDALPSFAEQLTATLPEPLRVCYFVNSGSEANELALRLARAHTGQRDLIVLDSGYHGNTTTLVEISPYKCNGPGGKGPPPWVHVVPVPDTYRGEFSGSEAGQAFAQAIDLAIEAMNGRGVRPSAFIAESAPSVAGQIVPPPGYLAAVYRAVRAAGGLCIADEVQTAYGRMGTGFYAFETQHVVPDIVVLGKPIGNGYPLGAVITTRDIARSFDNGMEYFSTFGGSTVACAVGLSVLDVVQQEGLQEHAREVGDRLLGMLWELAARHALVGDVRGSGLFLGVELVSDQATKVPATRQASRIADGMRERGVLLGTEGPSGNVLKIRPPMPFDERDAERLVAALDAALTEVSEIT